MYVNLYEMLESSNDFGQTVIARVQKQSTCLESPCTCTNNYTMGIIVNSVACFMLLFPLHDFCLVEVNWIVLIILDCYWKSFLNMVLEFLGTVYILVQSFRVSDRSATWAANGIYLFMLLKLSYFAIKEKKKKMISLNVNIIIKMYMDLVLPQ